MKKVSIIIPYYKAYPYLISCIMNLIKNTEYPKYEVIIVNDGSPDFKLVKDFINDVKHHYNVKISYIDRKENKLFAYTCNEGAEAAEGEYLHFLNADTVPLKGWLNSLVKFYESKENVGIVGSKLIYPELNLIQHIGGAINENLFPFHFYKYTEANLPFLNKKRKVLHSTAASMFMSKKDFISLGGFDDKEIRHTFEDTDLCFKLRINLKKEIWIEPKSQLYHYENVTGRTTSNSRRSLKILKKRWKNFLLPNIFETYEKDGFSEALVRSFRKYNIYNFGFLYFFIKKYELNTLSKQKRFVEKKDFKKYVKKELNKAILNDKYPVINEFSAMAMIRTGLLNREVKKLVLKKMFYFLEKSSFFKNVYNFGSYYIDIRKEKINLGKELLEFIAENKNFLSKDIIGRAFYKLSLIENDREKKEHYLKECLKVMPYHQKAKEDLERF